MFLEPCDVDVSGTSTLLLRRLQTQIPPLQLSTSDSFSKLTLSTNLFLSILFTSRDRSLPILVQHWPYLLLVQERLPTGLFSSYVILVLKLIPLCFFPEVPASISGFVPPCGTSRGLGTPITLIEVSRWNCLSDSRVFCLVRRASFYPST